MGEIGANGPGLRPSPPTLECRDLSAGYHGRRVLDRISFRVEEPAIYVVLGPNGAGKTTLFRTIAGILRPLGGSVLLDGRPYDEGASRDRFHFLSHIDGLPDGLRVEEALRFYAAVEHATQADVDRALRLLEIEPLRNRFVSELSAGQKKRTAIARLFLRDRDIYLLDEPTANLDPKAASEIRDLILRLSRERVVLYSSHNLFEAREIGRYVLAIKEGRLTLFQRIADLRTAKYVVGVRPWSGGEALADRPHQGEYALFELPGPQAVAGLLRELEAKAVQIREIREMGNPLEELFA